jgi:excisionase family DNA binding protein
MFSRVRRAGGESPRGADMAEIASLKPITVTVATALAVTGLGRTKFYELIKEGRIKTVSIGRRTLVVFADLEKMVATGASGE